VHDFGGYPFIAQLSRTLANRGHDILHLYASGFRKPKGPVERRPSDPSTLSMEPLNLDEPLQRVGFRRIAQERRYRRLLADRVSTWRPDIVLSANAPLEVQAAAAEATHAAGAAFVFWLQDLHSVAISRILGRRFRLLGTLIGSRFTRLERRQLRGSEAVVAISPDYLGSLRRWGVPIDRIEVIENWAPLDEAANSANPKAWATAHAIPDGQVILYAGTLALKHNPALLVELAKGLPDAVVVVTAEGPGADWLRVRGDQMPNVRVLPLQPYSSVADMLASADLLVAVLESDASTFSVPSKVLTYLAAGRAILAAIPKDNAAAQMIERVGAGIVVEPNDLAGLVASAQRLLSDPEELRAAGAAGRAFAQETFDIDRIADQFEAVFGRALVRKSHSPFLAGADTGRAKDTSHEASG
jgi:colanic acid biosynthesis glycosyl transferase WcaI